MSTMHLKCSPTARKRINALVSATRAERSAYDPDYTGEAGKAFNEAKSSLEQFIARLEQRVSQK